MRARVPGWRRHSCEEGWAAGGWAPPTYLPWLQDQGTPQQASPLPLAAGPAPVPLATVLQASPAPPRPGPRRVPLGWSWRQPERVPTRPPLPRPPHRLAISASATLSGPAARAGLEGQGPSVCVAGVCLSAVSSLCVVHALCFCSLHRSL